MKALTCGRHGDGRQAKIAAAVDLIQRISAHGINAAYANPARWLVGDELGDQFIRNSRAQQIGTKTEDQGCIDTRHRALVSSGARIKLAGALRRAGAQLLGDLAAELLGT